jgi:hypothetical protein
MNHTQKVVPITDPHFEVVYDRLKHKSSRPREEFWRLYKMTQEFFFWMSQMFPGFPKEILNDRLDPRRPVQSLYNVTCIRTDRHINDMTTKMSRYLANVLGELASPEDNEIVHGYLMEMLDSVRTKSKRRRKRHALAA